MFASLLSFIAALLTLIAIAIDIALYTVVHDRVRSLDGVQVRSLAAPGTAKRPPPRFSLLGIADTWFNHRSLDHARFVGPTSDGRMHGVAWASSFSHGGRD
jgi:hypothetical protein